MVRRNARRENREGTVFKRTVNGQFKDYRAVLPIYHPVTDKLIKRVYGYGPTADIALKRRNAKAYEVMTELGTLNYDTRTKLDNEIRDPELRAEITTLAEYAHKWLNQLDLEADRPNPTIAQSTVDTYRSHVDLHIVRHLGDYLLTQITTTVLNDFLNTTLAGTRSNANRTATPDELRKQGKLGLTNTAYEKAQPKLSPKTIKHIKTTLNQILQKAYTEDLIPRNPMNGVELRKTNKTTNETKVWWGEQILQQLPTLYATDTEEQLRWHLAVLCGMRQSEVLGVTTDRFMLNAPIPHLVVSQTLSIDTQIHGCGNRNPDGTHPCGNKFSNKCPDKQRTGLPYLTPFTKASRPTNDGVRRIPLPATTLTLAKKHLKHIEQTKNSRVPTPYIGKGLNEMRNLVFTINNGQARRPKYDNKKWHELTTAVNNNLNPEHEKLPQGIRQHTTRRICATTLARAGVTLEIAKQILGHSNELMTEYYTTRNLQDLSEPMRQIDHLLHTGDSQQTEQGGLFNLTATADLIRELAQADQTDTANLPET